MSDINRREFLGAAARLGLLAGIAGDPTRLFAADESRTIRGRVTGGDRPLGGVLVSDGRRVVRTDPDGNYELLVGPESGRFVFVTTPRGFWTERFYVPIGAAARTARADFRLEPIDQPDRFDCVFLADVHLDNRGFGAAKFKRSLEEINGLEPAPAFLWAQGDVCLQGGAGKQYVECLAVAEMPVRNGAGNHEMMLKHANPRDDFERFFGPTYYSFNWGPAHCIVLDGNKPIPHEEGWKAVHGAVEASEMAWLAADLAAQPPQKPIIVGVHIPIVSTYPERRQHSPKNAPYWEVTNDQSLTELFSRHGVRLVLQGHMHENERQTVGGVEYVESISISGSWWKAGEGFERGVDGCPRGYRIVSVDGTRVTHRYRSSCESHVDRRGEFSGLEDPLAAGRETELVFNAYDAPNGSTAEARIDGGPWRPMPAHEVRSATTPDLTMPHHFRLVADTTALKPGEHTIEARVRWPDGTVVTESDRFVLGGE
ncbi:MAG TPA: metallophosphoesterase N-terminal domain-containing protein [Thermoguttaceae bacterium]|nr:metallophosphoesterase N-terminal domain-containing protein [Thermoguttaceae bacterium]